jgi:general secretion pathway protein D
MIAGGEKNKPAGSSIQKQLEKLIVPKVEFKEATLGSVLDFLKQTAAKASEGKTAVNFVVQLPDEQVKTKTVTLSLTNVPMSEVLRYLGGLADIDFAYEKYAILVKPHVATTQTAPAQQ